MSTSSNESLKPSLPWERLTGGIARVGTSERSFQGTTKFGDKDESDNWDDFSIPPPPPPSKELHEKYGIEYCHSNIEDAIKEANNGDCIYLEDGHYTTYDCVCSFSPG